MSEPGLLAPVSIKMRRPPNPFKVAKPRQVEPGLLSTMRGHDISPAFVGGGIPALRPADRPLLWEWRYNIEGPCYMEAPQLAMLDPTGEYKLLMNPPGMDQRVELFSRVGRTDLFEAFDLSKAGENIDDSSTSFFVNSRTLMGCTGPRNGGRRTPSVPSRFGSKLPHLC